MKKILVIDDVETNLLLIKSILDKKLPDYKVLLANCGTEGLEMAKREIPETILLDVYMPGMDGFEVCRILKSDEVTRNIPVLMISAYGQDSKVRVKGLNIGADAFIPKPYHMDELIALVNVMLRIKNAEDLLRKQNNYLESTISKLRKAEKVQKKNLTQISKYQNKLKDLNSELLLIEEREKKAIAGYLHDGIGQTLSIAHIKLTSLLNNALPSKTKKTIDETSNLIDSAITDSRLLTYDLSPPILYELGLIPALKWKLKQFNEKSNITTNFFSSTETIDIIGDSRILIYRIVCELLANIIKHSEADFVNVEITHDKKNHYITVDDNGKGFDYKKELMLNQTGGYGLFSIKERLDSINGELVLISDKKSGTSAKIIVPIK
jgi:two-component system, sensor histidine kinase and response regulator